MQNCVPFGKRIFTWTVRQHFQSQPMKSTIIAIITSALALSCSVNKGEYKEFRKEEINNLYFEYYLSDQKFTDTLKVYSLDKDLIQFTVWENGSIISRSTVDDSGRIRELKLYERIDTTSEGISITMYYFDINEPSYRFFRVSEDLCTFFINHVFPSRESIYKDSSTIIELYNFQKELFFLSCTNGELQSIEDRFIVTPQGLQGDTLQIVLFGEKDAKGTINLKIK